MPQVPILVNDVFDIWGLDFMGPFPVLCVKMGRSQGHKVRRCKDCHRIFAH
ncbi:unnamed protein product [Rhodiola kirilowii]